MLITFNPGKNEILTTEFNNKNEWEHFMKSCQQPGQPVPFNTKPENFPCIMIYDGNLLPLDAEHNKYYNFFIYQYANA